MYNSFMNGYSPGYGTGYNQNNYGNYGMMQSQIPAQSIAQASQSAQNAFITANQEAQTAELIRRINPMPVPAFQVPAPYPYNNCGCGCGNGFGCGC